jgi:hypothetical protein
MRNDPFMLRGEYITVMCLMVTIVITQLYHNFIVGTLHVPAAAFQIALQWSMIVLFVGQEAFIVLTISHVELSVPVHRRSFKYWKAWAEREGIVLAPEDNTLTLSETSFAIPFIAGTTTLL